MQTYFLRVVQSFPYNVDPSGRHQQISRPSFLNRGPSRAYSSSPTEIRYHEHHPFHCSLVCMQLLTRINGNRFISNEIFGQNINIWENIEIMKVWETYEVLCLLSTCHLIASSMYLSEWHYPHHVTQYIQCIQFQCILYGVNSIYGGKLHLVFQKYLKSNTF